MVFLLITIATFLIVSPKAFSDTDIDKACWEEVVKFPYQADQIIRIDNRIAFELQLLKKYPTSYVPYCLLGDSYQMKGTTVWRKTKNKKKAIYYYKLSIRHLRRAMKMCKNKHNLEDMKREMRLTYLLWDDVKRGILGHEKWLKFCKEHGF